MKRPLYAAVAFAAMAFTAAPGAAAAQGSDVQRYQAVLDPVPTNRVNGSGLANLQLSGGQAQVTLQTAGLVNSWHALHIHIHGQGRCPDASMARQHNGRTAISATDGAPAYGEIMTSLTVRGDTGPARAFSPDRFPSGSNLTYGRTVTLDRDTVQALVSDNAVLVVHGIDYDGHGQYDDALGTSEDDSTQTQDATAPALCGTFRALGASATRPASPSAEATGSENGEYAKGTSTGSGGGTSAIEIASLIVASVAFVGALMAMFYSRAVMKHLQR
ncbi:hypothetical protein AB0C13_11670 [Streptomyces sp. NPDC049099]|uniref:hypothetical protein n=1 Tax=Streptomyces sp. NPDC049099 TaxID=3155768 RepID=UPI00341F5E1B